MTHETEGGQREDDRRDESAAETGAANPTVDAPISVVHRPAESRAVERSIEIELPAKGDRAATAVSSVELNGGGPVRLRVRVAVKRPPAGLDDFEFEPKDPKVRFWQIPGQLVPVGLIIFTFLFLCAGLLSRFVTPLNADEIDTDWLFCMNQYYANKGTLVKGPALQEASPIGLGAAHSGMHNLTFWLRALPYDKYAWVREHFDVWNRVYNLIATFLMLALLYGFARWALGHSYALIALFIATFMQYTYLLAIEGNYMNETSAAYLAAVWAFMAGERAKHWLTRFLLGATAGAFGALCWLLYFSGRLTVVGLLAYCGVRYVMNKRWLARSWPLLAGLFLVYAPCFYHFKKGMDRHPELVSYRQTGTQLLYRPQLLQQMDFPPDRPAEVPVEAWKTDSVFVLAYRNILLAFKAFYKFQNNYHSYSAQGYLDGVSVAIIGFGALLMLFRWRHPFFLMILLLFVMNNAVLGGLTVSPNPPYHQRVHFGILLASFIIAAPLWALTRLPRRWGRMGTAVAAFLCFVIAVVNSNAFMTREFSGKDVYMQVTLRTSIMGTYLERELDRYNIVVYNEGYNVHPFDGMWGSFNPKMRMAGAQLTPYVTWKAEGSKFSGVGGKRMLFLVQYDAPNGLRPPSELEVESAIQAAMPGGQYVSMLDDGGLPYVRAYIPPIPRATPMAAPPPSPQATPPPMPPPVAAPAVPPTPAPTPAPAPASMPAPTPESTPSPTPASDSAPPPA